MFRSLSIASRRAGGYGSPIASNVFQPCGTFDNSASNNLQSRVTGLFRIFSLGILAFHLPSPVSSVSAQTAQEILQKMSEMQMDRWESVNNYTVTISVEEAGGLQSPVHYQRMEVDGEPTFQMILPSTYSREMHIRAGYPPPEDVAEGLAAGYEMLGRANVGGFSFGQIPFPAGDGGMSMHDMSRFLRFSAEASRQAGDDSLYRANAAAEVRDKALFADRAKYVGVESAPSETISGGTGFRETDAHLLVADDLEDIDLEQPNDGPKFFLKKTSVWIDAEHFVPLRLLIDIEIEKDGKRTPMTLEKLDLDYKQVGPLYESHVQVSRITGLMEGMSNKERKDLEKEQKELEKAKKQIAEMPESQRAMVMKMMGGQMEKLEKMAAGGAIESTTRVVNIAVNEGPPTPYGIGTLAIRGSDMVEALTMAGQDGSGNEIGNAQLVISRGGPPAESMIELTADTTWPPAGQTIRIVDGSGNVSGGGDQLQIEGASGIITVIGRTPTRVYGTYKADLSASDGSGTSLPISIEGEFDSGAPAGPDQGLRGSPFQFFQSMSGSGN